MKYFIFYNTHIARMSSDINRYKIPLHINNTNRETYENAIRYFCRGFFTYQIDVMLGRILIAVPWNKEVKLSSSFPLCEELVLLSTIKRSVF
jgi:hypothetical protein